MFALVSSGKYMLSRRNLWISYYMLLLELRGYWSCHLAPVWISVPQRTLRRNKAVSRCSHSEAMCPAMFKQCVQHYTAGSRIWEIGGTCDWGFSGCTHPASHSWAGIPRDTPHPYAHWCQRSSLEKHTHTQNCPFMLRQWQFGFRLTGGKKGTRCRVFVIH